MNHSCVSTVLCRERAMYIVFINLCSFLLCMLSSRDSWAVPSTKPLSMSVVPFLWVAGSDAVVATDDCKADCSLHHRLKGDMHFFAANIEWLKLYQEGHCALPLLADTLRVAFLISDRIEWKRKESLYCHYTETKMLRIQRNCRGYF